MAQDGTCAFDSYGTYNAPTYTLSYAPAGSKVLPWAALAQRGALNDLNRYAWVSACFGDGQLQFQLVSRIRPADGGGVLQTTTLKSSGQSSQSLVPLQSTGATSTGSGASLGSDERSVQAESS